MTNYPREPHAGEKISATLIRDIIRCLRRITPLPGKGAVMRFTPNGTFIDGVGGAFGGGGSVADNGCWKIATYDDTLTLVNQFYQIGGTLFDATISVDLSEYILQGELEDDEEYTDEDKPFIALVVEMYPDDYGEASIEGFKTFEAMKEYGENDSLYVKPLYKLTHFGGIAVDLRNMPQIAAGEMYLS